MCSMYEIDRKLLIKQGEKLTEIGYSGKTSRRCDDKEDDDGNDGDIHHHDDNSNNNNNVHKRNNVVCQLEQHIADCCSASKPRTEF